RGAATTALLLRAEIRRLPPARGGARRSARRRDPLRNREAAAARDGRVVPAARTERGVPLGRPQVRLTVIRAYPWTMRPARSCGACPFSHSSPWEKVVPSGRAGAS